jgi:hypothetical protein
VVGVSGKVKVGKKSVSSLVIKGNKHADGLVCMTIVKCSRSMDRFDN